VVQAAVFDFDLTLADSTAGAVECVSYALRKLGLPPAEPSAIRHTVGLSLSQTFQTLTGTSDGGRTDEFSRCFIERADEVMVELTAMFPEVPEALARLRASGTCTAIVSTKFRYRIERILAREKLAGAFDVIVGGEDVARYKPDPEGLCHALRKLNVPAARAVYVGDHPVDAEAAHRAGVRFIAMVTGTASVHDFAGHEVVRVLSSLADLPIALQVL
jgi:phosphoglycolate phosphatase